MSQHSRFICHWKRTLPVGAEVNVDVSGSIFMCKEANQAFRMQFGDGGWFDCDQGLGFNLGPDRFSKLSFAAHPDAVGDTNIDFYTANAGLVDARIKVRRYRPRVLTKIVAAAATPEALGASTIRMAGLTFFAEKAIGVNNTGNVTIMLDGADAQILLPGDVVAWPSPALAGYYLASDFTIKVATSADGVRVIYSELQ